CAPAVLFDLIEHEGLVLGGSSAINIVGAMRLARDLGPGKTIVTILADGGQRYQSKLFNPEFLRKKNLPLPRWMRYRAARGRVATRPCAPARSRFPRTADVAPERFQLLVHRAGGV